MATTLTVSEILNDVLQAFKQRVPALNYFASDMSAEQVKYGQPIIAHIPTVPTVYTHTAATGYSENAQSARDLLTDVSITMDQWKHVTIKLQTADVAQDKSKNYLKTIGNAGYALGKTVVDYALSKVLVANISQETEVAIGNVSRDSLSTIRAAMNGKKAASPRYGIVSSDVFNALDSDSRIASRDYHGQQVGGDPLGKLINVAGFSEIIEYAELPANGEGLGGFFFDPRAVALATRLPTDSLDLAAEMGIPTPVKREIMSDEQSGLSIAGFGWVNPDTHYLYVTATVMFGAVAGSQGGAAGALTDYAGHRMQLV